MQRTFSYSSQQYGTSTPPPSSSGVPSTASSSSSISPVNSGSSSVSPSQQKTGSQEKVKLFENRKEREKYENMAELYSLIVSVERLEKAYVKDSIVANEYAEACRKLIAKFKTIQPIVSADVPDIERFMKEYRLDCPAATNRLLKVGVPATVEHGGKDPQSSTVKLIAQATQYFITVMDTIKLGLLAKDQLAPILVDLMDCLNSLHIKDFEGKTKIRQYNHTV
ncbi:hypothetical protein C9374_005408 [Naegleria lovaniensis]|uniref:Vacuolar protein sorting-associated protein 28 homolog n=1 Tax=Naegleria lovaniensis TaxID=51637 RepID=A0AA88KN60_NAELO|nr:uncharacterized protein C9374_005408 [Naegleria lovaniensis]KAG2382206.1 hypothetical protein C9374_005408 [Naegleria lovaniensis]